MWFRVNGVAAGLKKQSAPIIHMLYYVIFKILFYTKEYTNFPYKASITLLKPYGFVSLVKKVIWWWIINFLKFKYSSNDCIPESGKLLQVYFPLLSSYTLYWNYYLLGLLYPWVLLFAWANFCLKPSRALRLLDTSHFCVPHFLIIENRFHSAS